MTEANWYIAHDASYFGPFSAQELQELAAEGELFPTTLVWKEGMTDWREAREVTRLFPPLAPIVSAALPPPLPQSRAIQYCERCRLPYLSTLKRCPNCVQAADDSHATAQLPPFVTPSELLPGILRKSADLIQRASEQAKKTFSDVVAETQRTVDDKDIIIVDGTIVFGRSADLADWVIPDPNVAPKQATVSIHDGGLLLEVIRGTNTLVNGVPVTYKSPRAIQNGDSIQIGSASFLVRNLALASLAKTEHAHLRCERLVRTIERSDGAHQTLLNDITLNIQPRSFVVLLGPSGSGKTTLLSALNGRACATSGRVFLNQEDLYVNYNRLRSRIAYVPQKDILHIGLSLRRSLYYTARLRLPRDLSSNELELMVSAAINEVGMASLADIPMRNLSGGQLKRASVAHEMLSKPSLLCVDEATSGLDEHSDRDIMRLMREIASRGKTVVCITHNLANVTEFADTIVVMSNGGHLAFVGTVPDALAYFGVDELSSIYNRLCDQEGAQWGAMWKASSDAIGDRLESDPPDGRRALSVQREDVTWLQTLGIAMRHGRVVFDRIREIALLDHAACRLLALQPLLVFAVIWSLYRRIRSAPSTPATTANLSDSLSISFLLVVSTFWFGCSNSAKEVVKERDQYEKERHSGLSALGYLGAKLAWLISVTLLQSVLLFILVAITTGLAGGRFSYALDLSAAAVCGVTVGLFISVHARNPDSAIAAVPLALIPQVVLGGLLKPVDGFSEILSILAVPCYWGYGAITSTVCDGLGFAAKGVRSLAPMFAAMHPRLSWCMLWGFSTAMVTLSALGLSGVNVLKAAAARIRRGGRGGMPPTT
jgi:ABC-type multidrug transport system ATPase subunit